jgi:catechol 2,3-dioxygenase-like lactoylglutathione lyase family enzyme
MRSYTEAKAMARSLRDSLAARHFSLSHSECLEIVARQFGFQNWNVLSSKIDLDTGARKPSPEAADITFQPAIPVIGVLSAQLAKDFYISFLGFAFDWGEPHPERPMYAQISRSGVAIHLNEHERAASPGSEIFIRMNGLEAFHRELSTKRSHQSPQRIYATPDDRRELHVTDPFGNRLRFSQNNPLRVANAINTTDETG